MKKIFPFILAAFLVSHSTVTFGQEKDSGLAAKKTKGLVIATSTVDFKLSGGIFLYDYLPFIKGADNNFNIYAYILSVDATTKDKKFGLHVESRFRDTKLRSFFPSPAWLQEAYVFAHTNVGDFHVGKFYRKVGILWDGSFYGNVQYFNGLKLNPEFGAEWVGNPKLGSSSNTLEYSLQFISNNSGTDGALPGRDVQSDPNARFRNGVTARIAPTIKVSDDFSITPGVSALTGNIERIQGNNFQMSQLDGELTLNICKGAVFGEYLYMKGESDDLAHPLSRPGYDNANYYFAGVRYTFCKKLTARFSYSEAQYKGSRQTEREFLPGIVYNIRDNISLIGEYNYWDVGPNKETISLIDNSANIVVHYSF